MSPAAPAPARALTLAALLVLALPSASQAAAPSILNTAVGCNSAGGNGSGTVNQASWLVTCAAQGNSTPSGGNRTRVSAIVSHDRDKTIGNLLTDEWGNATATRAITCNTPSIQGGYGRSRCDLDFAHNTSGTGLSGSILGSCGTDSDRRYSFDKVLGLRARDSAAVSSGTQSSVEKFVSGDHSSGCTEPGDVYEWTGIGTNTGTYGDCSAGGTSGNGGNFFRNFVGSDIVPGTELTFCYRGSYGGSGEQFNGIRWRLRNLQTGIKGATNVSCPGGGSTSQKGVRVTFPDRGAFVVEAEALYGSSATAGCTTTKQAGFWFPIGSANVNSTAAPTFDLDATRPQLNGTTTVTADNFVDPDAGDGGGVQIIEWDLDENTTNGVGGFEETPNIASYNVTYTGLARTRTINTSGMSPGLHTVRARVTDNGAMDAADPNRRTRIVSTTFRVDSPPALTAPSSVSTEQAPVEINLSASDADSDTMTYSVTAGPSNGSGSFTSTTGASTTYNYTPNAGYAGTDSITFRVSDGFGGTDTKTVSITVYPQTQIDSGPNETTVGPNGASFTFSSPATGANFQCSLDGAAFSSCTSPQSYTDLSDGSHNFQVRAVAASLTDPTPAGRSFTVDATAPETTITAGRSGPGQSRSASFGFSASEPGSSFECKLTGPGHTDDFASCISPKDYSTLDDGAYTFSVRATDQAGNTDASPATRSFTVDTQAPDTTIESGRSGRGNSTAASFTFSSETGTSFECDLTGPGQSAGFTNCSSPKDYTGLSDGDYTFSVRATDQAANTDQSPATRSFTVDTTAPETTITASPPPISGSGSATFEFSSSEAGSTFECRLDAADEAAFTPCASPKTYTGLGNGPHTFEVRATDPAGNTDASPASFTWTVVDVQPPDTTITSGPPSLTNDSTPTFEFSSSEPGSSFKCRIDSSSELDFQSCESPHTTVPLLDGEHTFEVRASDSSGNTDPTPASSTFTVDTAAPETTITAGPPAQAQNRSPSFSFTSETGASFECKLTGPGQSASFTSCTSPKDYSNLDDGAYTFSVRATDEAGNTDQSPATRNFTVDNDPPATTITSGPSGLTRNASPSFTFSSESGASFECELTGPGHSAGFTSCTSPKDYTGLVDGAYTFSVKATDQAGNTDASPATRSFTVDTQAPDTTIEFGRSGRGNSTAASFTFSSETGASFECKLEGPGHSAGFTSCTSPKDYTGLADGDYTFSVRATDEASNTDPSPAVRSFTVDTAAPDTTIESGRSGRGNSTAASFTFSSEGGATFECELTGPGQSAGFTNCTSPKDYTGLDDGDYTFSVRATDDAGNTDPSPATRSFAVDTATPDTEITGGPTGLTRNASPSFSFTSETGASFECKLEGPGQSGGFGSCGSPKDYTDLADGAYTFSVRATDEAGNTDASPATRGFTVDTAAPGTTIDSGRSGRGNSTAASFTFSSETGASFECKLEGPGQSGGFTNCNSPKDYTGLDDGAYTFSVKATDQAGNTDASPATRGFTVDTDAPDTTIDSGRSGRGNSTAASFTFSSETGASFECELSGPGQSAGFTSCTSPKDYTGLDDGEYTFSVRARDEVTNTDPSPATRSFTVDTAAPDTEITGGPTGLTRNASPSFSFTSEGGASFVCKLEGPGQSAGFTNCSSPKGYSGLDGGVYTFSVRATDEASNTDQSPATRGFTVDTQAPDTEIDSRPSDPTTDSNPRFTFSSEGGATFECKLEGPGHSAGFSACESPRDYSDLAEGSYTFSVRATDAAGNTDASAATHSFNLLRRSSGEPEPEPGQDDKVPDTTISSGPRALTRDRTPTFTFTSTREGNDFACRLDGGAFFRCSSPYTTRALPDGEHRLEVWAMAGGGRADETPAHRRFTVDTEGPTIAILGSDGLVNGDGGVQMRLGCPSGESEGCQGTLTLIEAGAGSARTAKGAPRVRRAKVLGATFFRIRRGRQRTVTLELTPRAQRRIARRGKLRVTASLAAHDRAGNRSLTRYSFVVRARPAQRPSFTG